MKQKQSLLFLVFMLCVLSSFGQTFSAGGINYNITSPTTVEASNNIGFVGVANIPATVTDGTNSYSVTKIGNSAFEFCSGLTSVNMPNSVAIIGSRAFSDCLNLTSVTIPNSVSSIGVNAFYACTALTSLTIPNSVTSIGDMAFSHCIDLTSVIISNSVTSIGLQTFTNCQSLTSVTIPNSVTFIGDNAFANCFSLTSVTIPNSVTSIGDLAFFDCIVLSSVTIPNSVTSIGDFAFYECHDLSSVTISNSVTSIGNYAFGNCHDLSSVTIPNSVTSIGDNAFANCSGLTSVTVSWPTPLNVNANVFLGVTTSNIPLYVPVGTEALYDNALVWTDFAPITGTNPLSVSQTPFTGNNGTSGTLVNIYPNPTTSTINIECLMDSEDKTTIKLCDFAGKTIKEIQKAPNNNIIAIDVNDIANGVYNLQIFQDNKMISTQKVEKQ